MIESKEI